MVAARWWYQGFALCLSRPQGRPEKVWPNVPCMKLSGIGPFTVFAPTNDAFRLLGPGITTTLLLGLLVGERSWSLHHCWSQKPSLSTSVRKTEDPAREHSLLDTGEPKTGAANLKKSSCFDHFLLHNRTVGIYSKVTGWYGYPLVLSLLLTFVWRCYSITFVMATLWVRIFCRIRTVLCVWYISTKLPTFYNTW